MFLCGGDAGLSNSTGKAPFPKENVEKGDKNFFWSGTAGHGLTRMGSW